jgi:hypothetical protein
LPKCRDSLYAIPLLEVIEINKFAKHFADPIPEDELNVSLIYFIFCKVSLKLLGS